MKPAVVRPVVVLALVAAAWAQAPAAAAAKGGPAAKPNASAGVNFTKDGRTEVFSSTETDLATGEVSVFEVVREFDNLGLLVHERSERHGRRARRPLGGDGVHLRPGSPLEQGGDGDGPGR